MLRITALGLLLEKLIVNTWGKKEECLVWLCIRFP